MSDDRDGQIELAPSAPVVQQDENSQWMDWKAAACKSLSRDDVKSIEVALSSGDISVSLLVEGPSTVRLRVRQSPIGNYTKLYFASLRAIFQLEKQTGRFASIEGIPRNNWDVNFVTARQFGPFE